MTDELSVDDSLRQVADILRQPLSVAPGLGVRAQARQRRHRVQRAIAATAVTVLAVTGFIVRRPPAGTSVTFAITAPAGRSVSLVGDFTDWRSDRVELSPGAEGVWHATVRLPPGRYRYAFLVDHAQWRADNHGADAPDDFGRPTSTLTVVKQ
jgi:1,4-alpha-glucan branching enzyme